MNKHLILPVVILLIAAGIPLVLVTALLILDDPGGGGTTCGPTPVAAAEQLDAQQYADATTITQVAQQLGLPARAAVIAVATSRQESDLYNLDHGDRDSLGLFQQRPSQGWGTPAQILNPVYASTAFYRHLIAVPGWQNLPLTVAAQDVQRSALPDAYAQWEPLATTTVAHILGSSALTCPTGTTTGTERGAEVVGYAAHWLGTPYAYGGGTTAGPSRGFCAGGGGYAHGICLAQYTVGFDCSGLTLYAYARVGIALPHDAAAQYRDGTHVPYSQLQPGDLVFYATNPADPATIHHVGIYIGHGEMIDAPETTTVVRLDPVAQPSYAGATRP